MSDTVAEFDVCEEQQVPTVVLTRNGVPPEGIAELYDSAFAAFRTAIAAGEVSPTGPATAVYLRMAETVDVELGFPGTLHGAHPSFVRSVLPGGLVACHTYLGSYQGLAVEWMQFVSELHAAGWEVAGPCWESYVTQPTKDIDPTTLRTDLCCLVHRGQL
ncbi:GyrI-like domain-containing protein [Corynebacterium sp. H127]|uniref:GyrI-like domain-containing protein n=1 Tax=Corynebacterium sp. H127 TaxID=3133418 RepID=UPI0030A0ABD1